MQDWKTNILILLGCVALAALVVIVRGLFTSSASLAPQAILFLSIFVAAVRHRPFRGLAASVFVAYLAISGAVYIRQPAIDESRPAIASFELKELAKQRIALSQDTEHCSTPCAELLLERQVKTFIVDADTRRGHYIIAYQLASGTRCSNQAIDKRRAREIEETWKPWVDQDSPFQALGICFSATVLPAMPTSIVLKQKGNWNIGRAFSISRQGPDGEVEIARTVPASPSRIKFPLRIYVGLALDDKYAHRFPIEISATYPPRRPNLLKEFLYIDINGQIDAIPVDVVASRRETYERVVKSGEKGDQFVLANLLGSTKGRFPGQDDFIRRLMRNPDFEVKQMAISAAARMAHVFPKLREELETMAKGNDEAAEWASDRLRVLAAGPEWRDLL